MTLASKYVIKVTHLWTTDSIMAIFCSVKAIFEKKFPDINVISVGSYLVCSLQWHQYLPSMSLLGDGNGHFFAEPFLSKSIQILAIKKC